MDMICMRIQIDLDDTTLKKVEQKAQEERRKRKQMIQLIIERAVQK